jgi:hypothetical protein
MKSIITLILICLTTLTKSQSPLLTELEVNKLYIQFYKKLRGLEPKPRTELDSLTLIQQKHFLTLDSISQINHENPQPKFKTFDNRVNYYYLYINESYFSEVLSSIYRSNQKYGTEQELAKTLFKLLLESPSHKKILQNREIKSFNFKLTKLKSGAWNLIGVFSSDETFFPKER